jgi:hypothetical protein
VFLAGRPLFTRVFLPFERAPARGGKRGAAAASLIYQSNKVHHMTDNIEQRMLEKTVASLWRAIDELYSFHGRMSPRWAHDQRRDMALYYERRRKALAS